MPSDPLIISLDFDSAETARALVKTLGPDAGFYKVGMELYAITGPEFVRALVDQGKQVFLDLKFYDIPETVKRATAAVVRTGAQLLTIHASLSVMRAAAEGRANSGLKLLGVTVLTSVDQQDLLDDGITAGLTEFLLHRARNAQESGMDGIVASPLEARMLRDNLHPDLLIVTPGVRSPGEARGDQKRVATPAEALRDGASYLVIGRQVTRAKDPVSALRQLRTEIA